MKQWEPGEQREKLNSDGSSTDGCLPIVIALLVGVALFASWLPALAR
jgi:hypothetical protein